MYGSELCQVVNLLDYFISNDSGLAEYFSTLHDSVTYCSDFVHALDYGSFACCENFNNLFKSLGVSGEGAVGFVNLACVGSVLDVTVDTDSFSVTLSENLFICHFDELVLEGRTACVDYENVHFQNSFQGYK